MAEAFSWIVTVLGLLGFWLAGKKVWWSWYVNIVNQLAWVVFAVVTDYYAFLVGTAFYFVVFTRNAYLWTKDHFNDRPRYDGLFNHNEPIGELLEFTNNKGGLKVTFKLHDEFVAKMKKEQDDVRKYYRNYGD